MSLWQPLFIFTLDDKDPEITLNRDTGTPIILSTGWELGFKTTKYSLSGKWTGDKIVPCRGEKLSLNNAIKIYEERVVEPILENLKRSLNRDFDLGDGEVVIKESWLYFVTF